jgi:hypothetical protein
MPEGKLCRSLICVFIFAQLAIASCREDKNSRIAVIRKQFNLINADTSLKVRELDAEEFLDNAPDGGASLEGYYKKDKLVKIVEWIGLSYGNRSREFYLDDQKLFFVYEKLDTFMLDNATEEFDRGKPGTAFERRYYFYDQKLIEQKRSGSQAMDEPDADIAKILVADAAEYVELFIKAKKREFR